MSLSVETTQDTPLTSQGVTSRDSDKDYQESLPRFGNCANEIWFLMLQI